MTREEFNRLPRKARLRAKTLAKRAKRRDQIAEFKIARELAKEATAPKSEEG